MMRLLLIITLLSVGACAVVPAERVASPSTDEALGTDHATRPANGDFYVSNVDELDDAVDAAKPGDAIVMANGTWDDADILFETMGAEGDSITLRAETPGHVVLTGRSKLRIGGDYLIVDGLRFENGGLPDGSHVIQFRGDDNDTHHSRLTRTAIIDYSPDDWRAEGKWVSMYGTNNRIDHNYFAGKTHDGSTVVVWLDGEPNHHRIDHNFFGPRPLLGKNGGESIRIGTSHWSMSDSETLVEHNLFYRNDGEHEIISNKSGKNVYRHNTFLESQGTLTLRHGNEALVEGNFFIGNGVRNTGGSRLIGERHRVVNNYYENLTGAEFKAALPVVNGIPNSPLNRYFQVKDAVVAFNTFVNCKYTFVLGAGSSEEAILPPENLTIANNVVQTDSPEPVITLRSQPINLHWEGNVFDGSSLGLAERPHGILEQNPMLRPAEAIWRPAAGSPVFGAAASGYDWILEDIDGQPRPLEPRDSGADARSEAPIVHHPLTPADVGPPWLHVSLEDPLRPTSTHDIPGTLILDGHALAVARRRAKQTGSELQPALDELRKEADEALKAGPFSVVHKKKLPPSGDRHDYATIGIYWWPDPEQEDGLPYIRKDGIVNPESGDDSYDKASITGMRSAVPTLALGYFFFGDERYAEHAADLIRTWFIDPETRMNPNARFAQTIPGRDVVRGVGIIEVRRLIDVIDAVALLEGSQTLTASDHEALKQWFSDFLDWLLESEHGIDELERQNNHGTWYDVQVAAYGIYTGRMDVAREAVSRGEHTRLVQLLPDGRQPHELERTKAFDYSVFNLHALMNLARLGEHAGIALWQHDTEEDASIRGAYEWLLPYVEDRSDWPYDQIADVNAYDVHELARRAHRRWGTPSFEAMAPDLPGYDAESSRVNLLYPPLRGPELLVKEFPIE